MTDFENEIRRVGDDFVRDEAHGRDDAPDGAFVHVWSVALRGSPQTPERARAVVSSEERRRAEAFRTDELRDRAVVARASLRAILATYLDRDPASLEFAYGAYGKPTLAGRDAGRLEFNLAHADDLCVVAVARGRIVGIDVERIRPELATGVAGHFFSVLDNARLAAVAPSERLAAFFTTWVRKEAYLKARGDGLSVDLATFDVAVDRAGVPQLARPCESPAIGEGWHVRDLAIREGFAGAIAWARPGDR